MFFRRLRLKNSIFIHFWHAPNHNAKYFCEFLAILLTKIKQSTRLLTYYNNNIFKNRTKQINYFSSKWSAIFAKKSITSKQIAQKYYKIQKMMWRKMKYRRRQTQTRIWTRNQKNPNPRNPHFWKKSHLSFSFAILYLSWMEENYVTKAINNFVKYINTLMKKPNVSILETWNIKIWQSANSNLDSRLKKEIQIQKPPNFEFFFVKYIYYLPILHW